MKNSILRRVRQVKVFLRGPRSPGIVKLLDYEANYPIIETVMSYLETRDIFRLSQTCKMLKASITSLTNTDWNINRQLRKFFHDPIRLRSLQAKHDILITGPFATAFFARDDRLRSHMHLFIQAKFEVEDQFAELGTFLAAEGYSRCAVDDKLDEELSYDAASFQSVVHRYADNPSKFEVVLYNKNGNAHPYRHEKSVQVTVVCCSCPPLLALLRTSFHTASMNFITHNKAISLFPRATFVDRCTHLTQPLAPGKRQILAEWRELGWEPVIHKLLSKDNTESRGFECDRWATDKHSWVHRLNCDGVWAATTPEWVLDVSEFRTDNLYWRMHGNSKLVIYKISADQFAAPAIRHTYISSGYGAFLDSIRPTLKRLMVVEQRKIPKDQWMDLTGSEAFFSMLDNCNKPETWTYYDDKIPQWKSQFEEARKVDRGPYLEYST